MIGKRLYGVWEMWKKQSTGKADVAEWSKVIKEVHNVYRNNLPQDITCDLNAVDFHLKHN